MEYLQAIVLGAIRGLTEFLPISSSGHLYVARELLSWPDQGVLFDAVLHAGTLLAVLIGMWRSWLDVLKGIADIFKDRKLATANSRLAVGLLIATVPAAIAGYAAQDLVGSFFRTSVSVAIFLGLVGVFFLAVEWIVSKKQQELTRQPALPGAVWIGLAQILALLPGVSRSGITLSAGMLLGLSRASAARFAFLLSGPIIAGAAAASLLELNASAAMSVGPLIAGVITAFIFGLAALRGMLKFLEKRTLTPFAVYLVMASIALLVLSFFRII